MQRVWATVKLTDLEAVRDLFEAVTDAIEVLDLSGVDDPTDVYEAAVGACEAARDLLMDAAIAFKES